MSVYLLTTVGAIRVPHFSSKTTSSGNGRCLFTKTEKRIPSHSGLCTIHPFSRNLNRGNRYSEQNFMTCSETSRLSSVHLYITLSSCRFPSSRPHVLPMTSVSSPHSPTCPPSPPRRRHIHRHWHLLRVGLSLLIVSREWMLSVMNNLWHLLTGSCTKYL